MLGWLGEVGWVRLGSFGFSDSLVVGRLIPLLGWLRTVTYPSTSTVLTQVKPRHGLGLKLVKKPCDAASFAFKGWEVGKSSYSVCLLIIAVLC